MGSRSGDLILLSGAADAGVHLVGGKAATLSRLAGAGQRVCPGFVLTTHAYRDFVEGSGLTRFLEMEIYRKPMDAMRWEEIWDVALRVRNRFLTQPLPESLIQELLAARAELGPEPVAVRSSAPGEDGSRRSFAGLHESYTDISRPEEFLDAVRLVWASLWSDAALLYRVELGLDPRESRMAVLVQSMHSTDRAGVAFARDPRDLSREVALVEAVPGPCRFLVDGAIDPDRWELSRASGAVEAFSPGDRSDQPPGLDASGPLLEPPELTTLLESVLEIERLLEYPPDMEWSGRGRELTVLQARPITAPARDATPEGDRRAWYLSLRPGDAALRELRERVAEERIPALVAAGETLADEDLGRLDDAELAAAIASRRGTLEHWMQIYWDEFIPFAHGVRRLGTYYNDAVRPEDPYEFVELLRDQPLRATRRNELLAGLANRIRRSEPLRTKLDELLASTRTETPDLHVLEGGLDDTEAARAFSRDLVDLLDRDLDVTYRGERFRTGWPGLVAHLLELSLLPPPPSPGGGARSRGLLEGLLEAVGPGRREEALALVEMAKVSWRLRDDDNLLVGRLESQLLRALEAGVSRLVSAGRCPPPGRITPEMQDGVVAALGAPEAPVELPEPPSPTIEEESPEGSPRQLLGQPASPGLATGSARLVRGPADLAGIRRGEILVCDAIEPTMTHVIPLVAGIVERRGGMLIHGAIIARELGIPCVNGIQGAVERLRNGQLITVDGHLGIVTVGAPEFELELAGP